MRIIFMGSPDFAVPALERLIDSSHDIVAVITATDKMGGRGGKKLLTTPVKECALKHNIPVLQPPNLKATSFLKELKSYNADLQIVVAFRMLPVVVWDMPPLGTYNLHGSLLPKYRGAAPIHWAVIQGETETGVTSFKLKHAIDTGDFLLQRTVQIGPDETTGDIYEKLKILGADVISETVDLIETGQYKLIPQDESLVSKAPKLYRSTCQINWNQSIETVYNFIRGLAPFPTAWTVIDTLEVKIHRAKMRIDEHQQEAGIIKIVDKQHLEISAVGGWIIVEQIQWQGKRKMRIAESLNGYTIKDQKIQSL